jgi:hypothetical protein
MRRQVQRGLSRLLCEGMSNKVLTLVPRGLSGRGGRRVGNSHSSLGMVPCACMGTPDDADGGLGFDAVLDALITSDPRSSLWAVLSGMGGWFTGNERPPSTPEDEAPAATASTRASCR